SIRTPAVRSESASAPKRTIVPSRTTCAFAGAQRSFSASAACSSGKATTFAAGRASPTAETSGSRDTAVWNRVRTAASRTSGGTVAVGPSGGPPGAAGGRSTTGTPETGPGRTTTGGAPGRNVSTGNPATAACASTIRPSILPTTSLGSVADVRT